MATILFVRIKTDVALDELDRCIEERRPRFLEVPGLVQKIYDRDEASGDTCGIYFFESKDALAAFRDSELAKTIATAYDATEVRPEAYQILFPLKPGVGPVSCLLEEVPARSLDKNRKTGLNTKG